MSYRADYVQAVHAQPELLRRALERLSRDVSVARLTPWRAGETVAVVAMGASTNSGWVLGPVLARAGLRFANFTASEVVATPGGFQPADHYLLVTESGRSPEPIAAGARLTGGERIVLSNFPGAQVAAVTDAALGFGGFDDSPVYTVGYTATLLGYAVLLADRGVSADEPTAIPAAVADALARHASAGRALGDAWAAARSVDCVGSGESFAAASEAALMVREGLRTPAAGWDTAQYAHGPIEGATAGTVVVLFGDRRERSLVEPLLANGVEVFVVTATPDRVPAAGREHLTVVPLAPGLGPLARAAAEVVIAQLALERAIEHKPFPISEFGYHDLDTKLEERAEG
jgi:fructoselysine-6-P-deglycase FrlB-like protein